MVDEPRRNAIVKVAKIVEVHLAELEELANLRQLHAEFVKAPGDDVAAGQAQVAVVGGQPVANLADHLADIVVVILDVLAGDIRHEPAETIAVPVQNQRLLVLVTALAEDAAAHEQAEFIRHVETRQTFVIQLRARDVVDAEGTAPDDVDDLVDAHLAGIFDFEGAASDEAALFDHEHDSLKQRAVLRIERAVDEHAPGIIDRTR